MSVESFIKDLSDGTPENEAQLRAEFADQFPNLQETLKPSAVSEADVSNDGDPETGVVPPVEGAGAETPTETGTQTGTVPVDHSVPPPQEEEYIAALRQIPPAELAELLALKSALVSGDPEALRRELAPHVERMQRFSGEKLDEDLAAAVSEGEITIDYAKRMQQTRAKAESSEQQLITLREQQKANNEQAQVQEIFRAAELFETAQKTSNPQYESVREIFEPFAQQAMAQFHASAKRMPTGEETTKVLNAAWTAFSAKLPATQQQRKEIQAPPEPAGQPTFAVLSAKNPAELTVQEIMALERQSRKK